MYEWAELRHFRYLLTILEKQGFRAAADELRTAQPNLSVQAKQFQENASIRLFHKTKSGRIRPTDTGVAFKVLARFLLETRDEVLEALIAIDRGQVGALRLGCSPLADGELFSTLCELHREILPSCSIRPTHGDTPHLAEELLNGAVDAALVTLPLTHPDLRIEVIRRERLAVCLRRDHPLANRPTFRASDLQGNLAVFYHPQRHREAHDRLLELLIRVGVHITEHSSASHPFEMQSLVKAGHGFALLREGTKLDQELILRPLSDVDWTVDTALVYHKERYPKTIPILAKKLSAGIVRDVHAASSNQKALALSLSRIPRKPSNEKKAPIQMTLLG